MVSLGHSFSGSVFGLWYDLLRVILASGFFVRLYRAFIVKLSQLFQALLFKALHDASSAVRP